MPAITVMMSLFTYLMTMNLMCVVSMSPYLIPKFAFDNRGHFFFLSDEIRLQLKVLAGHIFLNVNKIVIFHPISMQCGLYVFKTFLNTNASVLRVIAYFSK